MLFFKRKIWQQIYRWYKHNINKKQDRIVVLHFIISNPYLILRLSLLWSRPAAEVQEQPGLEKIPISQGLVTLLHICGVIPTPQLLILPETPHRVPVSSHQATILLCSVCWAIAVLNANVITSSANIIASNGKCFMMFHNVLKVFYDVLLVAYNVLHVFQYVSMFNKCS